MTSAILERGASETARYVDEEFRKSNRSLHKSQAFGIGSVLHELAEVWEDCRKPDWDGYGASPVTLDALRNTQSFLEALPFGFPRPSISADPHGNFSLEWYSRRRRVLSVGITADGLLHFAILRGPNNKYGTEAFFDEVPPVITDLVRQVYS